MGVGALVGFVWGFLYVVGSVESSEGKWWIQKRNGENAGVCRGG